MGWIMPHMGLKTCQFLHKEVPYETSNLHCVLSQSFCYNSPVHQYIVSWAHGPRRATVHPPQDPPIM